MAIKKVTTNDKALEYLSKNPLVHMDMIFPIERGTAEILYAAYDGVCLCETKSGAYMMSVTSRSLGLKLLKLLPNEGLFTWHQSYMLNDFKEKVRYSTLMENYQAVYMKKTRLPISADIEITKLATDSLRIVTDNYDVDIGTNYLQGRIDAGELYGGYVDSKLVGFIGIHEEGSIGLLQILNKYQKNGYGMALTSFMVNRQLERQYVPFSQININNAASLSLMRKLGFSISTQTVYWLF
jgi:tRNA (guanine37-N1)-methyltransferase